MKNIGPYIYEDEASEQMLIELDEQVMNRDKVKLATEDATYHGQWSGSRRHGKGDQVWANCQHYEGYWVNDEHNGHGRMVYPDGSYYIGYWKNNERSGQGKLVRADRTVYEGSWSNDT